MLSNRTANFNTNEKEESLKIDNRGVLQKQLTTPLPRFDMHFKFTGEEEKEQSSFSFKNELLDNKVYNFIKTKDECLAKMELDDSIPHQNDDNNSDEKGNNENKKET